MVRLSVVLVFLLILVGCEDRDRIARLEKQNQALQESLAKEKSAVMDFDFQGKCAKDAREWFGRNYARDKDTVYLNFTNHYSKSRNKCFIFAEWHYGMATANRNLNLWFNDMAMFDVYENDKLGVFTESHRTYLDGTTPNSDTVTECEVVETQCKTMDEINKLAAKFMNQ
jgi:hypothetical protein